MEAILLLFFWKSNIFTDYIFFFFRLKWYKTVFGLLRFNIVSFLLVKLMNQVISVFMIQHCSCRGGIIWSEGMNWIRLICTLGII